MAHHKEPTIAELKTKIEELEKLLADQQEQHKRERTGRPEKLATPAAAQICAKIQRGLELHRNDQTTDQLADTLTKLILEP